MIFSYVYPMLMAQCSDHSKCLRLVASLEIIHRAKKQRHRVRNFDKSFRVSSANGLDDA